MQPAEGLIERAPEPPTGATATTNSVPPLLWMAGVGALVALLLGVYGRVHTPTGQGMITFGFPAVLPMKAWTATMAFALGLVQMLSAMWMWGRLPGVGRAPAWLGPTHRWMGTAAFLLSLPAGYHCLWALGFQSYSLRVLVHSLVGCIFYGIFVTKMLSLRSSRLPGWGLPVIGGSLVFALSLLWVTSSLWFFTNVGFPGV